MKYLFMLFYFLVNIVFSKDFSLEAYSKTTKDRVKVADNFIYENLETKGQWKDTEGQYGLFFCHGNIVNENSIKKVQSFCEYIDRDNDKAWTVMTSTKEIDLDNKMYQFDTTAEIGENIYLNGSGKYKKYIGYKCTFAIKYYDEEYNFLLQKCKSSSKNN
tara:strand:- start:176 stop:655 length:480 start_codon:yes stop_codon:yes gene_type:complete